MCKEWYNLEFVLHICIIAKDLKITFHSIIKSSNMQHCSVLFQITDVEIVAEVQHQNALTACAICVAKETVVKNCMQSK